jgi:hypothetical protein
MQKTVVKYLMSTFLVLIFLNRGLFVSAAYELDNQEGGELNSVIEWIFQIATGEHNDIDEDGDLQANSKCVNVFHFDCIQQFSKNSELANLFSKHSKNNEFSYEENTPSCNFFDQIDRPPEV